MKRSTCLQVEASSKIAWAGQFGVTGFSKQRELVGAEEIPSARPEFIREVGASGGS